MKKLILVFSTIISCAFSKKLPTNIETCKIDNANFNECLRNAIADSLPKLRNGVAELNVPPLDPLQVPSMTIGEGSGAVHVTQKYNNIKIYGATKTNMTKVDGSQIRQFRLYSESITPSLQLKAKYNLNGRILLIPISGDGDCVVTLKNLKSTHNLVGERLEKKGKSYMKVNYYNITLNPGKVEFEFQNLFNGDARLGKEMNNLLNENWFEVFEDVKKGYEESFGLIFGDFANKLFSKVPFDDIFLS